MSIDLIHQTAEQFRETVKQSTGIDIQYDEAGVALLEEMIAKTLGVQPGGNNDRIAQYMGAFLGEAMVKSFGMYWTQRENDGQWVVTIKNSAGDDITSNPWNKVFKRIDLGAEENISYYFAMVRKAIAGEIPIK